MRERINNQITQRTLMLAGISHDLRTPLTRIKLQIALLKDKNASNGIKKDVEEMKEMMKSAVEIEKEFICDSFQCNLIGINADSMKTYIEFQADRLIEKLGYEKIYNVECPFSFMDTMSLDGKSNFFEQRVTDYNRPEQIEDKQLEYLEDF